MLGVFCSRKENLKENEIDNDKGYSKDNCQQMKTSLNREQLISPPEDVYFLRSPYFDWEKDREYFTCSDYVY